MRGKAKDPQYQLQVFCYVTQSKSPFDVEQVVRSNIHRLFLEGLFSGHAHLSSAMRAAVAQRIEQYFD
jgi:hypothetical protein